MAEEQNLGGVQQFESAWSEFADRLADYLMGMADSDDHLVVSSPGSDGEGVTPYAQFCVAGPGALRAEISGNPVLREAYRLDAADQTLMIGNGWALPEEVTGCRNFSLMVPLGQAHELAAATVEALSGVFAVSHPSLLTAHAWGPAAAQVEALGLVLQGEEPGDVADVGTDAELARDWAMIPKDHDHLVELTREWLGRHYDPPVVQDGDGDFVITTGFRPIYVRVRTDQPVVEFFTCVVSDIQSRRQAAVEISVLNQQHLFTKFVLVGHTVWMHQYIAASPFVPAHLSGMLPLFEATLEEARDDLALRTSGRRSG